jgi:hypothetical protein
MSLAIAPATPTPIVTTQPVTTSVETAPITVQTIRQPQIVTQTRISTNQQPANTANTRKGLSLTVRIIFNIQKLSNTMYTLLII